MTPDDPTALYRRLIEGPALQWSSAVGGAWVCGQYDYCLGLLRDSRLISGASGDFAEARDGEAGLRETLSRWMVFCDGPEHHRIRQALMAGFSQVGVTEVHRRAADVVARLADRFAQAGGGDLVREVAWPLPGLVMGTLLGVDASELESLSACTQTLADFLREAKSAPELVDRAIAALSEARELFAGLIRLRRASPGDDVLSGILRAGSGGAGLDDAELSLQCTQLLFAGHETVRNFVGGGVLTLLRHPDALRVLREDVPGRIRGAVEELARFESPARFVRREARVDLECGGMPVRAGEAVLICVGAANRDGRRFRNPGDLDILRRDNPHLAFGAGPHACFGSNLARELMRELLGRLLEAFPGMELRAEPEWSSNPGLKRVIVLRIG